MVIDGRFRVGDNSSDAIIHTIGAGLPGSSGQEPSLAFNEAHHPFCMQALVDDDLCALSSMVNLRELALCNANGGCGDCYEGITGTGLIFLRDLPQLQVCT